MAPPTSWVSGKRVARRPTPRDQAPCSRSPRRARGVAPAHHTPPPLPAGQRAIVRARPEARGSRTRARAASMILPRLRRSRRAPVPASPASRSNRATSAEARSASLLVGGRTCWGVRDAHAAADPVSAEYEILDRAANLPTRYQDQPG